MVVIPRLETVKKENASHCRTWNEVPAVIFTGESVSEVVRYCKAPNVYVVTRTDASAKAVENRSVLIVACL